VFPLKKIKKNKNFLNNSFNIKDRDKIEKKKTRCFDVMFILVLCMEAFDDHM